MEEFMSDLEGYRPELQYSQLQPRNIDPDSLQRKSEGELMRTFQAKSLMGAALDQIAMDQMRVQQGKENAMRISQIAEDTHLPYGLVHRHVEGQAAAPAHRAAVAGLEPHSEAAASEHQAKHRDDAHASMQGEATAAAAAEHQRDAIGAMDRGDVGLFGDEDDEDIDLSLIHI